MYYRITIVKGKLEMNQKAYDLLNENKGKLEALDGVQHIRIFESDENTSVVVACYDTQEACETASSVAQGILANMAEVMTAPPAICMGEVTWEI